MATTRGCSPEAGTQQAGPRTVVEAGIAALVVAALAVVVVAYLPFGADWPAQDFRAFEARHWHVWTNNWYAGSALPGYSVLYPLVAAFLGSGATGVVGVAGSTFFAARLRPEGERWARLGYVAAVAVALLGALVIGQVTFLLGAVFGTAALLALRRDQRGWAAALAALGSLASPLVGFFLVLFGCATVRATGLRRSLWAAAGAAGSLVALVVDSGGGPYTYRAQSLFTITLFCVGVWLAADRRNLVQRDFAVVYLLVSLALFPVGNPIGGNAGRLGKMIVLPLIAIELGRRIRSGGWRPARTTAVLAVAAGLGAWWAVQPVVAAYRYGVDDPGRSAAYYRGLRQFLGTQDAARGRLEIPFTRTHTEASAVGTKFPLARGWERQVDLGLNDVLYHPLTAERYRRWLDENAVRLVAVSDLEPDIGGINEVELLRHPPAYLTQVWSDRHWKVWQVARATPIASAPARLTAVGDASLVLRFARPGTALVRITSSPFWTVDRSPGPVTLRRSPAGWLEVTSGRGGTVVLRARLNPAVLNPWNRLR